MRYLTRFEDLKLSSLRLKSFIQLRYLTNLKKLQIDNYGHPHCVTFAERTTLEQTAESKIAKDKQCSTLRKRYSVEPPIFSYSEVPGKHKQLQVDLGMFQSEFFEQGADYAERVMDVCRKLGGTVHYEERE